MKIADMRALSSEELTVRVDEWQTELFRARCNKAIGQLTNTNVVRDLRRQIAQAKTLINEKNRSEASPDAAK